MIGGPPFATGAVQVTTDWVLALLVPDTPVGALGATSEKFVEAGEYGLVPTALIAATVK